MTTTIRGILVVVLWLLFLLGLTSFCSRQICDACGLGNAAGPVIGENDGDTLTNPYELAFLWSDATPYIGENWSAYRSDLLTQKTENNILTITGLYRREEATPEGYASMGMARAEKIWKSLFPEIPEEQVNLRARLVDEISGNREQYFRSAEFGFKAPEEMAEPPLVQLDDRILIRFPLNSTEKDYDSSIEDYLKELAAQANEGVEKILLTGHTDNSGTEEYNLDLGQRRANAIKAILIAAGVNLELIETETEGEAHPVDSNENEEGRHNNRRVEVRITKKNNS